MRMLSPFSNSLMMNRQRMSPNHRDFFDDIDFLMNDFFNASNVTREMNFNPSCDISETEKYYLIQLDVPGVKKDDLQIEINNRVLKVSGQRDETRESKNDEKLLRFERSYGKFSRSFSLPESLDSEGVEAHFDNGVLQIAIPKLEATPTNKIEIKSGEPGFWQKLLGGKKDQDKFKDVPAS